MTTRNPPLRRRRNSKDKPERLRAAIKGLLTQSLGRRSSVFPPGKMQSARVPFSTRLRQSLIKIPCDLPMIPEKWKALTEARLSAHCAASPSRLKSPYLTPEDLWFIPNV